MRRENDEEVYRRVPQNRAQYTLNTKPSDCQPARKMQGYKKREQIFRERGQCNRVETRRVLGHPTIYERNCGINKLHFPSAGVDTHLEDVKRNWDDGHRYDSIYK